MGRAPHRLPALEYLLNGPARLAWAAPFFCILLAGCGASSAPQPPRVERVATASGRVLLVLDRPVDAAKLEMLDAGGAVSQRWPFTPGARVELALLPPPPPGEQRGRLTLADGRVFDLAFSVPEAAPGGVRLRLELPMGAAQGSASAPVWLPVEALATLAVTLDCEQARQEPSYLRLDFPPTIFPDVDAALAAGWALEFAADDHFHLVRRVALRAGEREQFRMTVLPNEAAAGQELAVQARLEAAGHEPAVAAARVRCMRPEALRALADFSGIHLPADPHGDPDVSRRPAVLQMPTRLGGTLRGLLGLPNALPADDEPFTWLGLRVRNRSEAALALELTATVFVKDATEPAAGFELPPALGRPGGVPSNTMLVPPGAERIVPLQVFVPSDVLPGRYVHRAEARLIGSDAVIARQDFEFTIEQTDRPPLYITLLAALLTLIGLPVLLWKARALLRRFPPAELVLTSLFGAAAFVMVNVPSQILSTLISAVVPVFGPFILGIWDTLAFAAIEGALIVLVPRPGVVLLSGGVRFLLNGVLFGAFSPISFLMAVPSLLAFEVLLWAGGCTRGGRATPARWALVFGLHGILAAGLNLALAMALYRLFYPDWYIVTYLALNGFIYHAAGAAVGARLGAALQRTAE